MWAILLTLFLEDPFYEKQRDFKNVTDGHTQRFIYTDTALPYFGLLPIELSIPHDFDYFAPIIRPSHFSLSLVHLQSSFFKLVQNNIILTAALKYLASKLAMGSTTDFRS